MSTTQNSISSTNLPKKPDKASETVNTLPDIATRIDLIRSTLPEGVELVAVSKFQPVEAIREAYNAGQRVFGESRSAELVDKTDRLPDDISWHFIGHLQTNKAKDIVGKVELIESVDSQRLLDIIDDLSARKGIVSRVLMQVHVAAETTKFGWTPDELLRYFAARRFENLRATHLCGLMTMATNTDDVARIEADFAAVARLKQQILEVAPDLRGFDILSMGMSDDYPIALLHGATHVRVGSGIFGNRTAP